MRVWIDIDNPPQVQYLSPFERAFARLGAEVVVTARDYDQSFDQSPAQFTLISPLYGMTVTVIVYVPLLRTIEPAFMVLLVFVPVL